MAQTEYTCWSAKRDLETVVGILDKIQSHAKNKVTRMTIKTTIRNLERLADEIIYKFDKEEDKQSGLFK